MLEKILSQNVSEFLQIPVWTVLLATVGLMWLLYEGKNRLHFKKAYRENQAPKISTKPEAEKKEDNKQNKQRSENKLKILYGTQTGKAKHFADELAQEAVERGHLVQVCDLKLYDPDDTLVDDAENGYTVVVIISTYTDGQPPVGCEWFYKWLQETSSDFRVQKSLLKNLKYTVFGLGNSLYKENYNSVSKHIDSWLHNLSAIRILPVGLGDENVSQSKYGGIEQDFENWKKMFWKKVFKKVMEKKNKKSKDNCKDDCKKCKCKESGEPCSSEEEELYETTSEEEDDIIVGDDDTDIKLQTSSGVVDLEDLGKVMKTMKKAKVFRKSEELSKANGEPREMITPLLRKSLEKQGYKLIGTHSGVKLCRWTKSMLRGRGGCYKHTFYGIESHRCMETTPSLACANKCVFCWRHHTNPVGTEWRWKMDDAEMIFQGALNNHLNMIKQFRGVPGVQLDKYAEAQQPQHCALSLVGEPIMYPEINRFIELLHDKGISSFMVTNAQFPDAIKNLSPVTQLYVSVDASTKDSLKKIDRPLFRDFWDRFIESLKELANKQQRTVYRLTLVKSWNTEELENYAKLVSFGKPDFIEIKGVTYCGESKASSLTMENVPWHHEVIKFVQQLADQLENYEIASEHEHSNCLLLANTKFKVNGEWHTWIDYPKFHQLVKKYKESNGNMTFSAVDYMSKTPNWAVFGADERGFDPKETRFFRKKQKDISGC